jgi:Na+/H+ antiporter NhaD/arsenite permease-like protein
VEYGQFIVLLFALFVVSGGVYLRGDLAATPMVNTVFLAIGACLANVIGTTGAAMLLIRPLVNTNKERRHVAHTVVFFIFTAANSGGLLTPLGDPPLFLGMLRGVPFTWTLTLWPEWLFINALLLGLYWLIDRRAFSRERPTDVALDVSEQAPLRLDGAPNLVWFAVIALAVAFMPSTDPEALTSGSPGAVIPWREVILLAAAGASYFLTSRRTRFRDNRFRLRPIAEVAALFVGIFLTMVPALEVLREIAPKLPLNAVTMFALTGGLSSVLDNTPTYATFFEMGQTMSGSPRVAGVPDHVLAAISLGAVLCGALTYIGNGPNLMVKSIADHHGVDMPSFGGYALRALVDLVPALVALALIFIVPGILATIAGAVLAAALIGWTAWRMRPQRGAAAR